MEATDSRGARAASRSRELLGVHAAAIRSSVLLPPDAGHRLKPRRTLRASDGSAARAAPSVPARLTTTCQPLTTHTASIASAFTLSAI